MFAHIEPTPVSASSQAAMASLEPRVFCPLPLPSAQPCPSHSPLTQRPCTRPVRPWLINTHPTIKAPFTSSAGVDPISGASSLASTPSSASTSASSNHPFLSFIDNTSFSPLTSPALGPMAAPPPAYEPSRAHQVPQAVRHQHMPLLGSSPIGLTPSPRHHGFDALLGHSLHSLSTHFPSTTPTQSSHPPFALSAHVNNPLHPSSSSSTAHPPSPYPRLHQPSPHVRPLDDPIQISPHHCKKPRSIPHTPDRSILSISLSPLNTQPYRGDQSPSPIDLFSFDLSCEGPNSHPPPPVVAIPSSSSGSPPQLLLHPHPLLPLTPASIMSSHQLSDPRSHSNPFLNHLDLAINDRLGHRDSVPQDLPGPNSSDLGKQALLQASSTGLDKQLAHLVQASTANHLELEGPDDELGSQLSQPTQIGQSSSSTSTQTLAGASWTKGDGPKKTPLKCPSKPLPPESLSEEVDDPNRFKKSSHKVAEQRRRDSLKHGFEDLRKILPKIQMSLLESTEEEAGEEALACAGRRRRPGEGNVGGQRNLNKLDPDQPNKGISKVALLRKSNEYILNLRDQLKLRDRAIEILMELLETKGKDEAWKSEEKSLELDLVLNSIKLQSQQDSI